MKNWLWGLIALVEIGLIVGLMFRPVMIIHFAFTLKEAIDPSPVFIAGLMAGFVVRFASQFLTSLLLFIHILWIVRKKIWQPSTLG
jgi:hypothetical protein